MPLQPPAPMGYIGSVEINGTRIRASSSSLQIKQAVRMPDVVDASIDRTLYQLEAATVEGDVVFPVVQDGTSTSTLDMLWNYAVNRGPDGELANRDLEIITNFSYAIGRKFAGCCINSFSMKATAGDMVEGTVSVFGTTGEPSGGSGGGGIGSVSPARVLAWNDVQLSGPGFETCIVKEFSFEINNNLARNYTFCPATGLFASNISTGKRYVQGSITFQGLPPGVEGMATTNPTRCNSTEVITFNLGGSCGGSFNLSFNNIVYEYPEVTIQAGANAPITSTVNFYAFGDSTGTGAVTR